MQFTTLHMYTKSIPAVLFSALTTVLLMSSERSVFFKHRQWFPSQPNPHLATACYQGSTTWTRTLHHLQGTECPPEAKMKNPLVWSICEGYFWENNVNNYKRKRQEQQWARRLLQFNGPRNKYSYMNIWIQERLSFSLNEY